MAPAKPRARAKAEARRTNFWRPRTSSPWTTERRVEKDAGLRHSRFHYESMLQNMVVAAGTLSAWRGARPLLEGARQWTATLRLMRFS